jgi:hypothetical protein
VIQPVTRRTLRGIGVEGEGKAVRM